MVGKRTKIFVDGNCIVCDFEISHYKKIAPELFDIVDISDPDFDAKKYSLTAEAVDKNMHVLTEAGELKIGVDAFAHIWSRIESYRFGAVLIKLPILYQLAKIGYFVFANLRKYLPKKKNV